MNESRRPHRTNDPAAAAQRDGSDRFSAAGSQRDPIESQPDASVDQESRSLGEMISGVVENLQNIVRYEVQLAKTELREEAKTAGKGAAMLAAGAVFGMYALGLFLLTAVWALATQMDRWLAALIVAAVVTVVAGVLAMLGKQRLDEFNPRPEETIESVKEDVEWVKQRTP